MSQFIRENFGLEKSIVYLSTMNKKKTKKKKKPQQQKPITTNNNYNYSLRENYLPGLRIFQVSVRMRQMFAYCVFQQVVAS